jgi:hypothetical protein
VAVLLPSDPGASFITKQIAQIDADLEVTSGSQTTVHHLYVTCYGLSTMRRSSILVSLIKAFLWTKDQVAQDPPDSRQRKGSKLPSEREFGSLVISITDCDIISGI